MRKQPRKYTEKDIFQKAIDGTLDYDSLIMEEILMLHEMLDNDIKPRTKNIKKLRRKNQFFQLTIQIKKTIIHILKKLTNKMMKRKSYGRLSQRTGKSQKTIKNHTKPS